jgi:tRNA threonylcarbamoyladenosine biosynthesis protein TsaE
VTQLELQTAADTKRLGTALASGLQAGDLIVLEGGLGAGKTFLVQAIARALGVPRSVPVTSPTFELVHEFSGRVPLVHADLYRINAGASLHDIGLIERIGHDALVLVEWGDRFADALGAEGLWVWMALGEGSRRSVRLEARGALGQAMVARVLPSILALAPGLKPGP